MKKLFYIILFIILSVSSYAQCTYYKYTSTNFNHRLIITVKDSNTEEFLASTFVKIISGTDTLKTQTNQTGSIYINNEFNSTKVIIESSLQGFKSRIDTLDIEPNVSYQVSIKLEEDPINLNSVIVSADAIAMVIKGDTTIFNKSAFKTKKDDYLGSLLKKMPGLKIEDNSIFYGGQKIDKLLINGTSLFGNKISDALSMVLADEVKSVKIYNADIENNPNNSSGKERIIDITTWNPLKNIGQIFSEAEANTYYNSNYTIGSKLYAKISNYNNKQKPNSTISLNRNEKNNGFYNKDTGLNVGLSKNRKGLQYQSNLSISNNNNQNFFYEDKDYNPCLDWGKRYDYTGNESFLSNYRITQNGEFYFYNKKNSWRLNEQIDYTKKANSNRGFSFSQIDETQSNYDKFSVDSSQTLNLNLKATYKKRIEKLYIDFSANLISSFCDGYGNRLDTLKESIMPEYKQNTSSVKLLMPNISTSLRYRFYKDYTAGIKLNSTYTNELNQDKWYDVLNSCIDLNNSKDYKNESSNSSLRLLLEKGNGGDKLRIMSSLGCEYHLQNIDEHLYNAKDLNKKYLSAVGDLLIEYNSPLNVFILNFRQYGKRPSVSALREVLDDSVPLYINLGNPDLKIATNSSLNIRYNRIIPSLNLTIQSEIKGEFCKNPHIRQNLFCSQNKYLDKYNYTIPKNATIVTTTNGDYAYSFKLQTSCQYYNKGFYIEPQFVYAQQLSPFYIIDDYQQNIDKNIDFNLYTNYSSSVITIGLNSRLTKGWLYSNNTVVYDYYTYNYTLYLTKNIGNHIELSTNANGTISQSTSKDVGYEVLTLNANATFKFGKDNKYKFSLFANNIGNSKTNFSTTIYDLYVSRTRNSYLGACVGLSFVYIFNRR